MGQSHLGCPQKSEGSFFRCFCVCVCVFFFVVVVVVVVVACLF